MTSNDQTPTRLDFARAAALIAHHIRQDVAGVTKIIRTAEADRRLSALLWAVADTAIAEDGNTIGTPEGIRALGELALDMATHATDEAPVQTSVPTAGTSSGPQCFSLPSAQRLGRCKLRPL
ncbi:hypothetical protein NIIDMKKI_00220 [Mycobacterium kansasii]|uniref:Uncharacterized protein n=1 Tax=Mycobacterium kansasii TaxID=1768 RepID=A0A7G1I1A0_MYCKA|nr:hypothetical protein NIIDMKKI_00220 [Mycobacterium kansasii]